MLQRKAAAAQGEATGEPLEAMSNLTAPTPYSQLPNLPSCPRCSGRDFEPSDVFLCDPCVAALRTAAREEGEEDRARAAFEDREFWGGR